MKKQHLRNLIFCGVFAAAIAVLSLISIPLPSGVPITLQTFIIAFTGFYLGPKYGTASVAVYILLGSVGVPVFSGFKGGIGVLLGVTGGFIFGFILLVFLCGIKRDKIVINLLFSVLGLALCHLCGVLQFSVITQTEFISAFFVVSLPYLLKDVISVAAAKFIALAVSKKIKP